MSEHVWKKRRRHSLDEDSEVIYEVPDSPSEINSTEKNVSTEFPREYDEGLVAAIFELGLKHASPKTLLSLMPSNASLTTEHIKSHLQKHRLYPVRSILDFLSFYNEHMRDSFNRFLANSDVSDDQNYVPISKSNNIRQESDRPIEVDQNMLFFEYRFKDICYTIHNTMIEHARIQHLMQLMLEADDDVGEPSSKPSPDETHREESIS